MQLGCGFGMYRSCGLCHLMSPDRTEHQTKITEEAKTFPGKIQIIIPVEASIHLYGIVYFQLSRVRVYKSFFPCSFNQKIGVCSMESCLYFCSTFRRNATLSQPFCHSAEESRWKSSYSLKKIRRKPAVFHRYKLF